jgi:hypothetical protein
MLGLPQEPVLSHVFIHIDPDVGFISEVPASGPQLRAVAAAWPAETVVTTR